MGVSVLVLHRVDPSANMARFYALSLENSLFGDILLVRRWGRIGTHGRVRFDWFDSLTDAANELARIASVKARRGYQELGPKAEPAGHPDAGPGRRRD
jgi:predicted DNA-binding WGR domain protein